MSAGTPQDPRSWLGQHSLNLAKVLVVIGYLGLVALRALDSYCWTETERLLHEPVLPEHLMRWISNHTVSFRIYRHSADYIRVGRHVISVSYDRLLHRRALHVQLCLSR